MTESTVNPPHRGLIYEGCLPLSWRAVSSLPTAPELASLDYANAEVLRTLFSLEIQAGEFSDEIAEGASQDISRLDFKLNLLLELVGQLLARQLVIPEPRPLTLMADGLLWQELAAPPVDSLLRIELYLNMKFPRPLVLHGRVRQAHPLPQGQTVEAAFHGLGESVRDGLERFIFVHHRRAVAQDRRRGRRTPSGS